MSLGIFDFNPTIRKKSQSLHPEVLVLNPKFRKMNSTLLCQVSTVLMFILAFFIKEKGKNTYLS
jgi:hypothetical protein